MSDDRRVIRAVLFDVGGPLDTEVSREAEIDGLIRARVEAAGVAVSDDAFAEASRYAVESFAPNAYAAMAWRLCGMRSEIAEKVSVRFETEAGFELRTGIPELLARLHGRGLRLGLAANQPAKVLEVLDGYGIGRFFHHREVSGHHGYRKPDVRLFLRACDDLGVEPQECVMVGDRVDNDMVPARWLGMRTVLFRTGRHIAQQPRSDAEVPDAEAWDVAELEAALGRLCGFEVGSGPLG